MERKQTKNKKRMKLELDRLSNLPSDVTEQILSYLPIKEAVRTSILSSNWRHKWATLRRLVFDDKTAKRNSIRRERAIDHVLLLHRGPINTFKLSSEEYIHSYEFDRWILYLSGFSIKEFILERHPSGSYSISSCLFSYKDLNHLGLRNCSLNPPLTFKGFAMLKSLDIRNVSVAKDVLEKIIVGSPLPERMILFDLVSVGVLEVDAPNLQLLKVVGVFEEIKLQNVPNLVNVSIGQKRIDYKEVSRRNSSKLLQYFLSLPRIERLTIEGCLLECVVNSFSLHTELPEPYPCLNFLSISMRLNSLDDILVAMYLLRSSPAIQVLEIEVRQESNAEEQATNWLNNNRLWEFTQLRRLKVTGFSCVTGEVNFLDYLFSSLPALQELEISFRDKKNLRKQKRKRVDAAAGGDSSNRKCTFNQLRIMKVTNCSGVKAEACFIRFLLSSSPMLNTMILQPVSAGISWELVELMIWFNRFSAHAELKS